MKFEKTRRIFLQILIGCLVAAAGLAVVAVLVGEFNNVLAKALATILLIALHSLLSFGFIWNNEKQRTAGDFSFFTNAAFVLIILSFITSLFGVWGIILSGDLVGRLYLTYFVFLFAILHGEVLAKLTGKTRYLDNIVRANYLFMGVVVLLLLPVIFVSDQQALGEVYYRLLAAAGIIDATLTLLAIILHKLYLQKHPTVNSAVFGTSQQPGAPGQPAPATVSHRGMNILVIILVGYLALQILGGLVLAIIGSLASTD